MTKANGALRAALCGTALLAASSIAHPQDKQPYKIFLSMSYVGNDWQAEAQNMVTAMAKAHSDKVNLQIQVAGPSPVRRCGRVVGAGRGPKPDAVCNPFGVTRRPCACRS